VPIHKGDEQLEEIRKVALNIGAQLKAKGITWKFDDRTTYKPGWKFAEYELKGYPVRIAIGPKDLENGTVELARRDTLTKAMYQYSDTLGAEIESLLEEMQINIYQKALKFREENTYKVDSYEEFKVAIDEKSGFYYAHWDGTAETEEKIKNETKATIRCIPLEGEKEAGKCMVTGRPSMQRVVFARAY
jgi:prolyl-tRNA synthetase